MSVYRVTEVIGVSDESWEAAARSAVETAAGTARERNPSDTAILLAGGQPRRAVDRRQHRNRLTENH